MTKDMAIKILQRELDSYEPEHALAQALRMAIEAMEQEPILDKIRAEIEQAFCKVENDYDHGRNYGLYMAMQIIDKYKAGSEEV